MYAVCPGKTGRYLYLLWKTCCKNGLLGKSLLKPVLPPAVGAGGRLSGKGEEMAVQIRIPEQVEGIISKLNENGFEAYAVGGCVRDTLLGREPGDWDITTSARPEQVKQIFRRTVDTGIQHGTVTIMVNHTGFEVTTYRIDGVYEDGRHPKSVEFTANLHADLMRRDFTINAMAYSHKTGIVDCFGGMEDLKHGVIRCVGNASDRFSEDALRMLRAVRFSAQLGFLIDEETKYAMTSMACNLIQVSKERIQTELSKLLLSSCPERMDLICGTGLSAYVSQAFHNAALMGMGQTVSYSGLAAEKHLRWAAFLRNLSHDEAVIVLKDLKMDNDTIFRATELVRWWKRPIEADRYQIRLVMSQMSKELFDDLLTLKSQISCNEETPELLEFIKGLAGKIREEGDCISMKDLAVNGSDLIKAGMSPGKELGEMLDKMFQLVLKEPQKNTKALLLESLLY